MHLSRFARDASRLTTHDSSNGTLHWYPPKGQVGAQWLPLPESTDEKLNLDRVNIMFILFCIQTAFSVLGTLTSLYCDRRSGQQEEQPDKKKKA